MTNELKLCRSCDTEKPLSAFYQLTRTPDGLSYMCMECALKPSQNKGKRRWSVKTKEQKLKQQLLKQEHDLHKQHQERVVAPWTEEERRAHTTGVKPGKVGKMKTRAFSPNKRCPGCKETKPKTEFHPLKRSPDGLACLCMECARGKNKRKNWSIKTKQQVLKQQLLQERNQMIKEQEKKQIIIDQLDSWKEDHGCELCGERDPICLEFHPIDQNDSDMDPTLLVEEGLNWQQISVELTYYIMVCSNCHKRIHAGLIELE